MEKMKLSSSALVEENGSVFQAYALKLQSMTEVKRAYIKVRQLHPGAAHVVAAYSLKNNEGAQD